MAVTFKAMGLEMPQLLQPAEVRTQAQELSKSVLRQWSLLSNIVEHYGSIIKRRWLKKASQQRKQILITAWGANMPACHRPDFDVLRKKYKDPHDESRDQALLWPYINLEDLSRSQLMLLFLQSRSQHHPEAFSRVDFEAIHIGLVSRNIQVPFLNEHVVMFAGRRTTQSYGELIAWEDHPDAFDWLMSKRGHHPGEGLLVLQIQDRLYGFLLRFCETILHDIAKQMLYDTSIPVEPTSTLIADSGDGNWLTLLTTTSEESPYRLPSNLNLDRLQSIVEAKLCAAQDHLWALREDPSYFAGTVLDWKEHRQENLLDTLHRKHSVFDSRRAELVLWERVIGNVMTDSFGMLEVWAAIHEQLGIVQRLKSQHVNRIRPEFSLPDEYLYGLLKLYRLLEQFAKGPIENLKIGLPASPPMRSYWMRKPENAATTVIGVSTRSGIKDKPASELIWLFGLMFDKNQLFLARLSNVLDELARLIEHDSKSKALISSWVADKIGDLAVFAQCIHQLDLYQPWAASFEDSMVEHAEKLDTDSAIVEERIKPYLEIAYSGNLRELGAPIQGRFHYPVNKRRTRDTVLQMRTAEAQLDDFWKAMFEKLSKHSALSPALQEILSGKTLERTPEWIESDSKPQAKADIPAFAHSFSKLTLQAETVESKLITPPEKIKVKTRGVADPINDVEQFPEQSMKEVQKFEVDNRAFKVFTTLFYTPGSTHHLGEVPWTEFVYALRAVGFMGEKMYGSVWQFTPTKFDVSKSIQFHEPHPHKKMSFITVRRYGRRLFRNYGLQGEMFTLE